MPDMQLVAVGCKTADRLEIKMRPIIVSIISREGSNYARNYYIQVTFSMDAVGVNLQTGI